MKKTSQVWPLKIRFLLLLFVIATALHWPWEMFQMRAYQEMADRSWSETSWRCFQASLGDGLITIFIYSLTALMLRLLNGERVIRIVGFISLAIVGAIAAIAIEWLALTVGRWSYTSAMPIVSMFNVGLLPLLQLILLIPLTVKITFFVVSRTYQAPLPGRK